jgi:chorismate mutase / prephenate dehydratase
MIASPAVLSDPSQSEVSDSSLDDLRNRIDQIDDTILELLQTRMAVASRIGGVKATGPVNALKLRPDREARVIARLLAKAEPDCRQLALGVWREIMAAGLARQGELEVVVWGGPDPAHVLDNARRRFGSSPRYVEVDTAGEALAAAAARNAVAVLAIDPKTAWWTRLAAQYRDLWVFDAIDSPKGGKEPGCLAVARIDPASLAGGRTFVISAGGDAGGGEPSRRLLGLEEGWRLYAVDRAPDEVSAMDRYRGVIGRAPTFSLSVAAVVSSPEARSPELKG